MKRTETAGIAAARGVLLDAPDRIVSSWAQEPAASPRPAHPAPAQPGPGYLVQIRTMAIAIGLLVAALVQAAETAKPPQARLGLPQSIQAEYNQLIAHLDHAVEQHGNKTHLAQAARTARDLIKSHFEKDAQFVFPPLGLLPALAEGRVTPEMEIAVKMGERVRADHDRLFDENVRITSALNDLIAAARDENDQELGAFATHAALRSLHEIEVLQPTTVLISEYIRIKLAGTK
jgi:hypothetical protein